jgi:Tfp pilus assembly protein PilV
LVAGLIRGRGFSLAEVVLALALIAVTVLTLLGLSLRTLQANRKVIDTGAGQMVLEQALEQMAHEAESSDSVALWSHNSLTVAYSSDPITLGNITYLVSIYAHDLTAASGTPFASDKRLKLLQGSVVWRDLQQGRSGYGQLRAQSSRLVHEP